MRLSGLVSIEVIDDEGGVMQHRIDPDRTEFWRGRIVWGYLRIL
jgi:hypothetical protein